MKLRGIIASTLALALTTSLAFAQSNQGTSPLTPTKGGTNSAFVGFTGPASSIKTFTLPNASDTIATLAAIQTFTAAKTFNNATLLLAGSSSGTTTLVASAAASGTLTLPAATDTLVGKATTDTLTNKTFDTAGTGNSFSINGVAATANTGTGAVVRATSPTLVTPILGAATATSVNKVAITAPASGATLAIPDGVTLTGPASSGTAMTLGNTETVTGIKTFGSSGAVGRLKVAGTTSGSTTLDASATASGTLTLPAATDTLVGKATTDTLTNKTLTSPVIATIVNAGNSLTLPSTTDTLVGRATTDTLTNKTFDTAGTGNSFSINGVAATANTGTGAVVRATSPTLVTPALGTPASGVATNLTGLPLSGHTAQGAYTIVANNSGSSAAPTAVDVTAITAKASPVSADIVLIQDSAASNAFKKTTVGALASAGSVASYNGRTGAVTATGIDVPLRGYLSGLTLSTAGSSATFGIAIGVATDSTSVSMMSLGSAYTKTTSAWALGTAAGSLDTGAIANSTWYHAFLIQRPDTGVVDVLISLSATAPTMPTNYTLFRRIGSMKTNGSAQWTKFIQEGNVFTWDVPVSDVSATNPGTAAVTRTLTTPLGLRVQAQITVTGNGSAAQTDNPGAVLISDLSTTDTTPVAGTGITSFTAYSQTAAVQVGGIAYVFTNTSSQVRSRLQLSSTWTILSIATLGWIDTRGRDS